MDEIENFFCLIDKLRQQLEDARAARDFYKRLAQKYRTLYKLNEQQLRNLSEEEAERSTIAALGPWPEDKP